MVRALPLSIALLAAVVLTSCGDDDDDGGGAVAAATCGVELLEVERINGSNDFRIRARNNNDVAGQLSFFVLYTEGGVQDDDQGIGVAQSVDPGTIVEIETIGGSSLADFDCASLRVNFISQAGGTVCQVEPIGEDCYD